MNDAGSPGGSRYAKMVEWHRLGLAAGLSRMVQRAIIRRELPARCDADFAADMIVAPLYWRLVVTGGRADDDHLDELAATVAAALGAAR